MTKPVDARDRIRREVGKAGQSLADVHSISIGIAEKLIKEAEADANPKSELTEEQYLLVGDLAKLNSVNAILRDIMPGSNPHIDGEEFTNMLETMYGWINKTRRAIEKEMGDDE